MINKLPKMKQIINNQTEMKNKRKIKILLDKEIV